MLEVSFGHQTERVFAELIHRDIDQRADQPDVLGDVPYSGLDPVERRGERGVDPARIFVELGRILFDAATRARLPHGQSGWRTARPCLRPSRQAAAYAF